MKQLFICIFLSYHVFCFPQNPKNISLTFNKTIHLIFTKPVYYYDVGSDDILVDKKNAILKLAPKIENFEQTNLTVVTSDNVWYTFLLNYAKDIDTLTYFLKTIEGKKIDGALVQDTILSETKPGKLDTSYINDCRILVSKPPTYYDKGAKAKKIFFALNNIFIRNEKLFFVVSLGNSSNINYDINFIKLYVNDKVKAKSSSTQELEKTPLFVFNKISKLQANTKCHYMVFVYQKFTLSDDLKLVFEMGEKDGEGKDGGRKISFDITKDLIINALPIN